MKIFPNHYVDLVKGIDEVNGNLTQKRKKLDVRGFINANRE